MAGVREKYFDEGRFFFLKLLTWGAFLILLAFALMFAFLWILMGPHSEEKEQAFYDAIASRSNFRLQQLFPSEKQCVLPGGAGALGYVYRHFPRVEAREARSYDSQDDWFIILLSETENKAEIIPIRYEKANLKNEEEICSTSIVIAVDIERSVRARVE